MIVELSDIKAGRASLLVTPDFDASGCNFLLRASAYSMTERQSRPQTGRF